MSDYLPPKTTLSLEVIIITKNEELHIEEAVKSAKQLSESVLVVDSGSNDNTISLAEAAGAKVIYHQWAHDYGAQRNFALSCSKAHWVFFLDADERITPELAVAIKQIVENAQEGVYDIARHNIAFGRAFKYGVLGRETVRRLQPRLKARWEGKVHEAMVSNLPAKLIKEGYLLHYPYRDYSHYQSKMEHYSLLGAEKMYLNRKKTFFIRDMVLRPMVAFCKMYLLKLGFLEGWLGLALAISYVNYTVSKYTKLMLLNEQAKHN